MVQKPPSLSAHVLSSENCNVHGLCSLRGHAPLWRLYNSPDSLPPISVIISVTENKALSEEETTAQGGSLCGGHRLALCHRSDKPGLCTRPGRGLALLWVGNSGGINSELTQRTALHHMKTLLVSLLAPSLAGGTDDHMPGV